MFSGKALSWAWLIGVAASFLLLLVHHYFFPGAIISYSFTHIHHWMYSLPIVVILVILKAWRYDNFAVNFLLGFFVGLVVSEYYWILIYGFPKGFVQIFYWILLYGLPSEYVQILTWILLTGA